eukprot:g4210.t1
MSKKGLTSISSQTLRTARSLRQKPLALLIDGPNIAYRAFFGGRQNYFRSSDGAAIGGSLTFCRSIVSLLADFSPDFVCVALEGTPQSSSFRKQLYPKYKAQRKKMPVELREQMKFNTEALHALGIQTCGVEKYEADDVLATYATRMSQLSNCDVVIVSSDKDLLQMVEDQTISVYNPHSRKVLKTSSDVFQKLGVIPSLVVDMQTLAGDSSDNIAGVKGIGPKTAANLICQFGSWREAMKAVRTSKSKFCHRSQALADPTIENELEIYQKLVSLEKDLPLAELERWNWSNEQDKKFKEFCAEMEFPKRGWRIEESKVRIEPYEIEHKNNKMMIQ